MRIALYLCMKKLQTIYIPTSDNTNLMVGSLDKRDFYQNFEKTCNVKEQDSIVFTQNEFNEFLENHRKEILNGVESRDLN